MIYILAGDGKEATDYINANKLETGTYFLVYGGNIGKTRRWHANEDSFIRMGSWATREDIGRIERELDEAGFPDGVGMSREKPRGPSGPPDPATGYPGRRPGPPEPATGDRFATPEELAKREKAGRNPPDLPTGERGDRLVPHDPVSGERRPVDPQTGNVDPQTGNVDPQTGNVDPQTGRQTGRQTGHVDPATGRQTGHVDPATGRQTDGERGHDGFPVNGPRK